MRKKIKFESSIRPFVEESEEEREAMAVEGEEEDEGEEDMECGVCEGVDWGNVEKLRADKEERVVKGLTDPRRPRMKEMEQHMLHHVPYRNWCPVCA